MTQEKANGNDDNQLSPATADLKSRMANTPLKQSWEEAAEIDVVANTAEEEAMAQPNENGQNVPEENNLHESTVPEHTSTNQQENSTSTTNDGIAQENPTTTTNNSHYTLGFEGDESSTNSDKEMGLDSESIKQNRKNSKRASNRLAGLPPPDEENEKDAT